MSIDPDKLLSSMVEAARRKADERAHDRSAERPTRREIIAAFLNALLADDEAMKRGANVFNPGLSDSRERMRRAIIAAVTKEQN